MTRNGFCLCLPPRPPYPEPCGSRSPTLGLHCRPSLWLSSIQLSQEPSPHVLTGPLRPSPLPPAPDLLSHASAKLLSDHSLCCRRSCMSARCGFRVCSALLCSHGLRWPSTDLRFTHPPPSQFFPLLLQLRGQHTMAWGPSPARRPWLLMQSDPPTARRFVTPCLWRFHVTRAELSSCNRDHTACKALNIYCLALFRKSLPTSAPSLPDGTACCWSLASPSLLHLWDPPPFLPVASLSTSEGPARSDRVRRAFSQHLWRAGACPACCVLG